MNKKSAFVLILGVFGLLYASVTFQASLPGYVGLAAYVFAALSQVVKT